MRVLIFALLAIAAVSCTAIRRPYGRSKKQTPMCQPYSTYSASTYDVYNGGSCYCNNDGSAAYCRTTYEGSNFSYTQTSRNKRGNLGMCLADGTCFKVPLKKDLRNAECTRDRNPVACTAEQHGRTFDYTEGYDDDNVDGSVTINGTIYQILPIMLNGHRLVYM